MILDSPRTLYTNTTQDEEALLCKVASQHDLADSFQLRSTEGWQTLQAILKSTGERIPKRRRDDSFAAAADASSQSSPSRSTSPSSTSSLQHTAPRDPDEPLTKRMAAFRLNERRPGSGRPRPS